jgi:MFS family permease
VQPVGFRDMLRGNLMILTLNIVLLSFTMFVTFPYFSLYVRELGGSNVIIGLIGALTPFAAMLMFPIAGNLVDNIGRVKILVVSSIVDSLIFTLFFMAPDWRYLALASFFNGLQIFTFPASSALMADSMPTGLRGRGYAFFIAIPGFFSVLSPMIGGFLITLLGTIRAMRMLYGATVGVHLINAFINWRFLKETFHSDQTESIWSLCRNSYKQILETIKGLSRELKYFAVVLGLGFLSNSVAVSFWIVHAKDVIGLTELQWGTILTIVILVQMLLTFPAGVLIDRYEKKKIIAISLLTASIPVALFPHAQGFVKTLSIFIPISMSNAFLIPAANSLMADMTPIENRGRIMAALGRGLITINTGGGVGGPGMGFLLTFPSIVGSLLGGYIYTAYPFIPWYMLCVSSLLSSVIITFYVN